MKKIVAVVEVVDVEVVDAVEIVILRPTVKN